MHRSLRHTLFAGAAIALLTAGGAAAQGLRDPIETGSDRFEACSVSANVAEHVDMTQEERVARLRCRNYLSGFAQASIVSRTESGMTSPFSPTGEELFCYELPDAMTWHEMEHLVVAYGGENADALSMYASDFLVEVFVANYPCPNGAAPDEEHDMDGDTE